MKGSIRQRSAGSWELTVDLDRDALDRCRRKYVSGFVRGPQGVPFTPILTFPLRGGRDCWLLDYHQL